jgi:hypothetical protein
MKSDKTTITGSYSRQIRLQDLHKPVLKPVLTGVGRGGGSQCSKFSHDRFRIVFSVNVSVLHEACNKKKDDCTGDHIATESKDYMGDHIASKSKDETGDHIRQRIVEVSSERKKNGKIKVSRRKIMKLK